MASLPLPPAAASLRIDGVAHRLSALAVLDREEALPGGLRWSLELDKAWFARTVVPAADVKTGRPSRSRERYLFLVLRKVLEHGGRPQFYVASIEWVEVGEMRLRLAGRCAPLFIDALGSGGLTRISKGGAR